MKKTFLLTFTLFTLTHASIEITADPITKVKKALCDKGVSPSRVEEIFQSKQALAVEKKAVRIISDITNIKKHRKAEKKANNQMLLKSTLIKKHLKKYKSVYDKVEKDFKVNREIVAAILQKETALGSFKSYKHNALSVFISMLKGLKPHKESGRAQVRLERFKKFAYDNLIALICFYELRGEDVLKADLRSSYAGAIGIPQFSPMHFDMIKSPTNEENMDLHDMPTAIYSTANLLKNRFHWKKKLKYHKIKHLDAIINRWREFDTGVENFVYETNLEGILVPTFVNSCKYDKDVRYVASYIKVLKRYNFSTAYALGILQIAKASRD